MRIRNFYRVRGPITLIVAIALASSVVFVPEARAQLATSPWPMFHHGLSHTGLSQYDTSANNGTLKWAFTPSNSEIRSSPAIGADGTIYFVSEDQNLYATNPDGTQKWAFYLGAGTSQSVESSPAIGADGTIYVGSQDDNVYAVNPNGTQKWTFATNGIVHSSPAIGTDGTIYIGSDDGHLYALTDGGQDNVTQKWAFGSILGTQGTCSPAIGGDGTIYDSSSGALFAINADGTEKWEFVKTVSGTGGSSPAIGADGTIYFISQDGNQHNVYAVTDGGQGTVTQKWAFPTGLTNDSTPAVGADGTIYVDLYDGLFAINPDGTQKWEYPLNGGGSLSSPAIGADGTIYIAFGDGLAINPDGTQKWSLPGGGGAGETSPAIGADGTVYVTTDDASLYAIGVPPTTISVPASLALGSSPVGNSVTKNLTVKNTGTNPLFVGSVTSNNPEFAATGATTCPPGGLAHLGTCTIAIGFTPSALGARSATLSVNDNTATSPQHVALSGTGTVTMTVTPTSFAFGSVMDGKPKTKAITVHNFQHQQVSLSESFSGANAGDFSVTGGTCTATLPATSSCSLIVTFAPTVVGTESATMTVTDSPDPLGPYTVSFTASADIPESVSPTSLHYGNVAQTASKTLSVTVTNHATSGSITLTGASIGGANAGDFAVTGGSCGGSLAASSSCTYAVTFAPSMETAESGTLSIGVAEDPNGGPPAIALSGTGVTPLKVTPVSIAFGTIAGGHSSFNKTVTVTNSGSATLTISETVTGPNAGDFAVTGGTCGPTLAGGGTHCTYLLKFTPSIVGSESATLGVTAAGDAASPHNVSLTGTGS
jgi:outer membrane protein assembly factor BamB